MIKVRIVFVSKRVCWKVIVDLSKCKLSEILVCIEEQYKL